MSSLSYFRGLLFRRCGRPVVCCTRRSIYYRGREFYRIHDFKVNYAEVESRDEYWISGPRRDGQDRLYSASGLPIEIGEDGREEYWRKIRKKPGCSSRMNASFQALFP